MAKKNKKKQAEEQALAEKQELAKRSHERHYPCKSCEKQCAGHGGGVPALGGGCMCHDGVLLECL